GRRAQRPRKNRGVQHSRDTTHDSGAGEKASPDYVINPAADLSISIDRSVKLPRITRAYTLQPMSRRTGVKSPRDPPWGGGGGAQLPADRAGRPRRASAAPPARQQAADRAKWV